MAELTLSQTREKFAAEQKTVTEYYNSFKTDTGELAMNAEQIEKGLDMNKALKSLGEELKKKSDIENSYKALKEIEEENNVTRLPYGGNPSEGSEQRGGFKTLGQRIIELPEYKSFKPSSQSNFLIEVDRFSMTEAMKTTMATSAGFSNANNRLADIVPFAKLTPNIAQLMPNIDVDVDTVKYMEATTNTNSTAGTSENSALPESAYAYTERSKVVELLGTTLPVTEQQLQVPQLMQSLVDDDLMLDLRIKEDLDLLTGDGNTPNILGLYNTSSIQTYAKAGADSTPDAVLKAITKVRFTGYAEPDAIIMHPNDWQECRLLRSTTGDYIFGNPWIPTQDQLWGLRIVVSPNATEGTALVGAFGAYTRIYRRQAATLEWGWVNDDFKKYKRTARITERLCLVVRRPAALCTVSGI